MSPAPWSATIDISENDVAKLIQMQFPSLTVENVSYLGEGWDNKVFLVNGNYVFRFPRREEGVTLMAHEIRVMPLLAPHIHLPIAHPRFIGYPTDQFPHPFAGYDYLQGDALAELDFSILPETEVLTQLAHFLRELHAINLHDIPTDITEDIGRMDYEPRVPAIIDGLAQIERAGHVVNTAGLMALVKECASSFPAQNTCIVHGDLHPRHILIKDKKISGIIDWGDMSLGCKAMDLSIIYTLYPRQYHDAFWAIYGEVSHAVKQQALFRAIYSNVMLGLYALDMNYPLLLRSVLQGLGNCLG
jgi:aminoglycoside phosphotransferase (APT) family kinase protein